MRARLALLLPLALAACEVNIFDPGFDRGEFLEARDRWEHHAPDRYRFELVKDCFCGPFSATRLTIEVHGYDIVAAWVTSTGEPVHPAHFASLPTIDELFIEIDHAWNIGVDDLSVSYDLGWGYPRFVDIDYEVHAVDDEVRYRVSGVRAL